MASEQRQKSGQGFTNRKYELMMGDQVQSETRWFGFWVLPFVIAAAVILWIWPDRTALWFSWPIEPGMTARMLGSAYIGGILFFVRVVTVRRWHTIQAGFLPVIVFTTMLGTATLLHWETFAHNQLAFIAWCGLNFTTPFLALAVWFHNRPADPGESGSESSLIPGWVRVTWGTFGVVNAIISLILFLQPAVMIAIWPWDLTPLTARVVGAMFALPAVLGMEIAADSRWSAARLLLEAQALSVLAILFGVVKDWSDFNLSNPLSYTFARGLGLLLVAIATLYAYMETSRGR
jgi:hypothetical protein